MSTAHWAILTITQTLTATGYKIIVTTDIACHLWMRWTTIKPQEHKIPILQRGIYLHTDKYFCFDAYEDNEQEEAGDTLTHTFIKEPWPECETRYFYFHGTIAGVPSVSTTAIFKKHRPSPAWGPPIEDTFLADTDDGYLATTFGNPFNTYAQNWNAATAVFSTIEAASTLINNNFDNNISIYRGILFFDTTPLLENCLIISAYVRLNTFGTLNPRSASLCITPATNVHKPIIGTDYDALLDTPTILASHLMENLTVPPGMILDLTEEGLTHITKAGITKFSARIDNEIDANGSPVSDEYIRYHNQDDIQEARRPILVITYKLPA